MIARRPPPGPQVASGRIRVDAAKAIAKLRAFRLADPTAWILEAVRAAVAAGATRIALAGDADDLWLRWDGPAWPAAVLPDLFDELISPEPARDGQARRLLATAVNSALALAPAWVDVYTVAGGEAVRVRFTPATVAEDERGEAALRALAAVRTPMPDDAPASGMMVHLRRAAGLDVLARFLRGDELPELTLARAACADLDVPMTIGGRPVGRDHGTRDVVRVPLGDGLDGWLALRDPRAPADMPRSALHVCELGVRICADEWIPRSLGQPRTGSVPSTLPPVRVVIDAPRIRTNASRSQVDHAQHPVGAALRRAEELVPALVARLRDEPMTEERRRAALAVLAFLVAGPGWMQLARALDGPAAELAALPLVRNAVGEWHAVTAEWERIVHEGDEPLDGELAPWLATVPWMPPGDPARALFGPEPESWFIDPRQRIKAARRRRAARDRFRMLPVHDGRVAARPGSVVRVALGDGPAASCVPAAAFAGMRGEVCVMAGRAPGRVTLLHEQRPLEIVPLEAPLSIEAVIDGAPLTPDEHHRRALDNAGRRRALAAARDGAIRAVEVLVASGNGVIDAERAALIRGALVMVWDATHDWFSESPLLSAPVWRTVTGAAVSIAALRRARAVGVVNPELELELVPPHERTVVVVGGAAREALFDLLEPGVAVVPYGPEAARPPLDVALTLGEALMRETGTATLVIREETRAGAISFAPAARLTLGHRGVAVGTVARQPALYPCAIAIDGDALVPDREWREVRDDAGLAGGLELWERALLQATARAMLGEHPPDLLLPARPVSPLDATGLALCAAIGDNLLDALGVDLAARLRAHPLLRVLGEAAPISADELARRQPNEHLAAVTTAEVELIAGSAGDGVLLVAEPPVRAFVQRLLGRNVIDGAPELRRRLIAAELEARMHRHRTASADAVALPAGSMPIDVPGLAGARVGVGFAAESSIEIHVAFQGKRFSRIVSAPDLPLCATVSVDLDAIGPDLSQLAPGVRDRVLQLVRAAADALLLAIARDRPTALVDHPPTRRLLAAWLASDRAAERGPVHDAVRGACAWPTLQGARVSLAAASSTALVPVARWTGIWRSGEPADILDGPVIALPTGPDAAAWCTIIDAIGPYLSYDMTDGVARLQAERARTAASPITPSAARSAEPEVSPPPPAPPAVPPPAAPPARPALPPHPLRDLAIALRTRLDDLAPSGLFVEHVTITPAITEPLVAATGAGIALAGDAALLRELAAFGDRAAVDALAAHVLTVLNAAHTAVTDDVERIALRHLLAPPG